MFYPNNMMYGYGFMSPFHWIGGLFELLFWLVIIVVILRVIRGKKHGEWMDSFGNRSALNILRERYAKGEISKEEYEERRKVLEHK